MQGFGSGFGHFYNLKVHFRSIFDDMFKMQMPPEHLWLARLETKKETNSTNNYSRNRIPLKIGLGSSINFNLAT
jgi:hypothetical protein